MEHEARLKAALADRYLIEREIGAGGMATVYLAQDLKHEREVAVKVMRPELAASIGIERFLREIQIAAKLHHPHILMLIDSGEANGVLYYVMPLIKGESLSERLNRETQLPIEETVTFAGHIAAALDHAHAHEVVHRDIKPANILISEGQAIVTDFGIARAINSAGGDRLTGTGLAVGSPIYMSPEQAAGGRLDGRSDIYSLGCVVFEMLIGDPPFAGRSHQAVIARHSAAPVPSLSAARETVPCHIDRAVQKAMAKLPADRYSVASGFAKALASPTHVESVIPSARRSSRLWESPASVLGGALSFAVLGSTAFLAWEGLFTGTESAARLSLPPYLAAWVTTMIGIWFLFEKAEETVTASTRQSVARWLHNIDPAGAVQTWPASFVRVFDRIFGERHLSWRCFNRSCLASFSAVIIVALVWTAFNPFGLAGFVDSEGGLGSVVPILLSALLLNFVADYLSLLETRFVLSRMEHPKHAGKVPALVGLDLLATVVIWFLVFLVLTVIVWLADGVLRGEWHQTGLPEGDLVFKLKMLPLWLWVLFSGFLKIAVLPGAEESWIQIWFLSTFVTSVWLWLYAAAGFAVRLASLLGTGVDTAQRVLDIRYRPIRSLGLVAMLFVTLFFAANLLIRSL